MALDFDPTSLAESIRGVYNSVRQTDYPLIKEAINGVPFLCGLTTESTPMLTKILQGVSIAVLVGLIMSGGKIALSPVVQSKDIEALGVKIEASNALTRQSIDSLHEMIETDRRRVSKDISEIKVAERDQNARLLTLERRAR